MSHDLAFDVRFVLLIFVMIFSMLRAYAAAAAMDQSKPIAARKEAASVTAMSEGALIIMIMLAFWLAK